MDRIRAIEAITTVPLVIHGGSGVPVDQRTLLAKTSSVCKFNIGTELRMVFGEALRSAVNADPDRFDRVTILKETHDPLVAAARLVLRAFGKPNESSGGIFPDMMIHDFDMARFLLGEEPVQVFAVGSALVDPAIGEAGDVDTAAVTLTTASGKICQISNSRRATYGYDQRVEALGEKGILRAANMLENTVEVGTAGGFKQPPRWTSF